MNKTAETFTEQLDLLLTTPSQPPSLHIALTLRSNWDTAALFIHMARDHGLPSYPHLLAYCHDNVATENITFSHLKRFGITDESIKLLKTVYDSPYDVDAMVGLVLEGAAPGSLVGPTLGCLLKEQFKILKRSDRFWYENDLPPSSLTTAQLNEVKRTTISGVVCANTEDLERVQPNGFVQVDEYLNAMVECEGVERVGVADWMEMDMVGGTISEDVLMEALQKAEMEVLERRRMEWRVWSTVGGADPKSPVGTAASFSKANKQALKLANSSLLFEFASNEIINSLM